MNASRFLPVARLDQIPVDGCHVADAEGQPIALFRHDGKVFAVDNRCPHLGFPLSKGTVQCGVLTCHWHHARFDLQSGGTFDPWADDVRAYPVRIAGETVEIDVAPPATPPAERYRRRLVDGLRQNLRLLIAKAAIGLDASGAPETAALTEGALFGTRYARNGWGSGLTILTAMANILPALDPADRPRALYHGLTQVAGQTAGQAPAVLPEPLPTGERRPEVFSGWLRDFVEVRNRDGAERALGTAIAAGVPRPQIAQMLFAAATDHRYLSGGHTLDFINKAFELLDRIGWEHAGDVLSSVVPVLTGAARMEESSAWRHPIDLVALLEAAFAQLEECVAHGAGKGPWTEEPALVERLLGEDPAAAIEGLLAALRAGATGVQLAAAVALAAARRVAHFRTSNEFADWITVLHTFTYANAVHQALRRAPCVELLRGVFDGATSVYLDRFLNMPPTPLPAVDPKAAPERVAQLMALLDRQQAVGEAARLVAGHLDTGRDDAALLAALGQALLREDAEFHTYQMVEAGFRQYADRRGTTEGRTVLIAVARYLAAHSPTARAMGQTYRTALRLHRGEALFAEDEGEETEG